MKLTMYHPPIGLRTKTLVLSLFLLGLPWLGYKYVWEMEKYLRYGQEKTLEGTTQAVATALHERPKLFDKQASFLKQVEKGRDLYAYPLNGPIQLDGKLNDWDAYSHKAMEYGSDNRLFLAQNSDSKLHFRHMVGKYSGYLYAFFEVTDPNVVYRGRNSLAVDRNDMLAIATLAPDGKFRRYVIANMQDGWLSAFELPEDPTLDTPVKPEIRIQGQWKKSAQGYNIELRMPLEMVGSKLGFAIHDVNDKASRKVAAIVGTSATDSADKLGTVLVPSPEIESIIKGMGHNNSRIWVVDIHGRVLAKSGNLHDGGGVWAEAEKEPQTFWTEFQQKYLNPIYYKILTRPPSDFVDTLKDSTELQGSHIQQALAGKMASTWRLTQDKKAVVLAAASPIWIDDKVMGAVIAEETTHGIRTLRNRALEKLFNIILIVMSIGTLSLFFFASSISTRVRKLRDQAEKSIDSQGRIRNVIEPSPVRDEIGDLSRSFANVVGRLSQYTHYLENMSSRLSHELRTPVAVVRSSLEHLSLQPIDNDAMKYVDRAQEGVKRLSLILSNMSEATRLEESLSNAEADQFPLSKVISGCVAGYQMTYPTEQFAFTAPKEPMMMLGVPEYIAQLMDKLISNAIEFHTPGSIVQVKLLQQAKHAILTVENLGPQLPENMTEEIFESMVSVRSQSAQQKPHLGLGLYIARLIAAFHGGSIRAANLADGTGVVFTVTLPLQSS